MRSFKDQAKTNFKNGFKRARSERGLTQEGFVSQVSEKYGADNYISISTVRNWEQGRSVPELDTLLQLCDFFDCSLDYLFCRIDPKTHTQKNICDVTGLSVNSVKYLNERREEECDMIDGLNTLLGSANFENALSNIVEFTENLKSLDTLLQIKRNRLDILSASEEYSPNLPLNSKIYEASQIADLSEFQVSKHFTYILRELRRKYNPTSFREEKRNGKHKKD